MIDEENILGLLPDRACKALAVLPAKDQRAQNQEVECTLEERDSFVRDVLGGHPTRIYACSGRLSTQAILEILVSDAASDRLLMIYACDRSARIAKEWEVRFEEAWTAVAKSITGPRTPDHGSYTCAEAATGSIRDALRARIEPARAEKTRSIENVSDKDQWKSTRTGDSGTFGLGPDKAHPDRRLYFRFKEVRRPLERY